MSWWWLLLIILGIPVAVVYTCLIAGKLADKHIAQERERKCRD